MEYLVHWASLSGLYDNVEQLTGKAKQSRFEYVSNRFYIESTSLGSIKRDAKDDMHRPPNSYDIAPGGLEPIMTGSTQTGGA